MYKWKATILKDLRILTRDKVGLALMFVMPILLALVITSIQLSTFNLVNDNKIPLLVSNQDKGPSSVQLMEVLDRIGMFDAVHISDATTDATINALMQQENALLAIIIPADFSEKIKNKTDNINQRALSDFGLSAPSANLDTLTIDPLTLYYHPVLQESYRQSIHGALSSALQIVETKSVLQKLYFSLNEKEMPKELEEALVNNHTAINEIPASRGGSRIIPNATQHNIPAWTVFAMFFIVTSLGSNVVREKLSGSFVRLKTLPTSYIVALAAKMIAYMIVCLAQVFVIFAIGFWIFPLIGFPPLNLPADKIGLLLVSMFAAWCAISYAIFIGVFAQTQEQANGFGAVSVVILAAIGGILVPSFAMPDSFAIFMRLSPLHWALESYYGLFLEGGNFADVIDSIIPLIIISIAILTIAFIGLKKKNLI